VFIKGGNIAEFEGIGNDESSKAIGFSLNVVFDDTYQKEYEDLVQLGGIKTLPIENTTRFFGQIL